MICLEQVQHLELKHKCVVNDQKNKIFKHFVVCLAYAVSFFLGFSFTK